jgi:hypothetical protein
LPQTACWEPRHEIRHRLLAARQRDVMHCARIARFLMPLALADRKSGSAMSAPNCAISFCLRYFPAAPAFVRYWSAK